jgi:hypothetical protein
MTVTDKPSTVAPLFEVSYTSEELAVLADLYDLETLPGVQPLEMALDLRSLATRCLVARGIVVMPGDGGVEITQPHATLLAGMFEAPMVLQVSWIEGDVTTLSTWFDLGTDCVRVGNDDEGIVEIAAFTTSAVEAIEATLGIEVTGTLKESAEADVIVEMARIAGRHDDQTVTTRSVVARVDGRWWSMEGLTER